MSEDNNKQETKVKVIQSDNLLFKHNIDPVTNKIIKEEETKE